MKAINSVLVRFTREGCEISVSYTDDGVKSAKGQISDPAPGTKSRTTSASRMARAGLQYALQYLDKAQPGDVVWGGFSAGTQVATDNILVDRPKGIDRKRNVAREPAARGPGDRVA
jgi:hypothetical protein